MNELYEWMELLVMRCDLKAKETGRANDRNRRRQTEEGEGEEPITNSGSQRFSLGRIQLQPATFDGIAS